MTKTDFDKEADSNFVLKEIVNKFLRVCIDIPTDLWKNTIDFCHIRLVNIPIGCAGLGSRIYLR